METIPSNLTGTTWRIDELLGSSAADRKMVRYGYCSAVNEHRRNSHFAKWFWKHPNEEELGEELDRTTETSWSYFQRQAIVATRLSQLIACQLDVPQPLLVFPRWSGVRLDDWLSSQSQLVTRVEWVTIALAFLQQLLRLHRLGFVHRQLCLEHLWLTDETQIQLIGLGRCETVGEVIDGRLANTVSCQRESIFLPPERDLSFSPLSGVEISSAEDIYSAAAVIDKLGHGQFLITPIGRCMTAESPYDRPTASELVELFTSYYRELIGSFPVASDRAA